MNEIVKQNGLYLFIFDREVYSVDENVIKNDSDELKNDDSLRKYLNRFIDLMNSDLS